MSRRPLIAATVVSAMHRHNPRWLEWTVVLFYGLAWPQRAYVVASRSRDGKAAEFRERFSTPGSSPTTSSPYPKVPDTSK